MQTYINILLGFILANIIQILNRNPQSDSTPVRFNLAFYFEDSWQKLIVSFVAAIIINYLCVLYWVEFVTFINSYFVFSLPTTYSEWIAVIIGATIDTILQIIRKQMGLFQPEKVQGFIRK